MTTRTCCALGVACFTAVVSVACGGVSLKTRPGEEIVVLTADPEDSHVGAAVVRSQGREVELSGDRSVTRVRAGRAPTTPATVDRFVLQRRFADAIQARPLPPRQFVVFFENATDEPTAESQALLREIVEFVRSRPAPDISIIGHTDTTDSAQANVALGLRRAMLVRDRLLAIGLATTTIDVASHGEVDPLIPTADNVAEPRNRRVEIVVR